MDFEYSDDQLELRAAARSVLTSACPPSVVRSVVEGGEAKELWPTLVGLDWPALGLPEAHGGLGLGFLEVGIIVEELGRVVAPSPFLATVTQFVPVVRESPVGVALLEQVAAGRVTGSLALAEGGRWEPEAVQFSAERVGDHWVLRGRKSHVLDARSADELVVVARGAGGLGAFLVPGAAAEASRPAVLDPTLPVATVAFDGVEVGDDRVLFAPGDTRFPAVLRGAIEEATVALALSTVATCRAIFEATLQYAKDREQFGRPIGAFQAVKHRLAECYLAVERADSLATFAALTIAEDDDRRAVATAMAKAAAGECQRLLVRDGLQLHGGIGFTWEHDLHFHLKRAITGDLLFGNAATQRARLAGLLGLEAMA